MDLEKLEKQIHDISSLMTIHVVEEIFEKYSLAEAPEFFFSGFLFLLMAAYADAKEMTPDEAIDLMKAIADATIETFEGRKENNEDS